MRVVLLKDVPSLGPSGSVVEVKEGYARNYLLPRGLARQATEGALRAREHVVRAGQERRAREEREAERLAETLKGMILEVKARAGAGGRLFGAVTAQQVAETLAARGLSISRRQIELERPIRIEGIHKIAVRLPAGRVVRVDVNVVGLRPQ